MTENEAKWEYCRAIDLIKRIKTEETHERYIDRHKAFDLAIQELEEIQAYRAIGTVEEFKDLKEKSVAKKLKHDVCPNCSTNNDKIIKHLGNPQAHKVVFCWNCGQALEI